MLIASLTVTLMAGIDDNPAVPTQVSQQADTQLSSGVSFMSDADLKSELEKAQVPDKTASAIVDENAKARLSALRAALAIIAIVAALALLFSGGIPTRQPGSEAPNGERGSPEPAHLVASRP